MTDPRLVGLTSGLAVTMALASCAGTAPRSVSALMPETTTPSTGPAASASASPEATASASESVELAPPLAPPPPRPSCDTITFVHSPYDSLPDSTRRVEDFGDLNGDGESELLVAVHDGFRNEYFYLLERRPSPACFRELLAGDNTSPEKALSSSTKGWRDLRVRTVWGFGMGPPQFKLTVWKYDGERYADTGKAS